MTLSVSPLASERGAAKSVTPTSTDAVSDFVPLVAMNAPATVIEELPALNVPAVYVKFPVAVIPPTKLNVPPVFVTTTFASPVVFMVSVWFTVPENVMVEPPA